MKIRIHYLLAIIGALVSLLLAVVFIIPMITNLRTTRATVDGSRAFLSSLELKQRNITTVTRDYDQLIERGQIINEQFLSDANTAQFFNALDALFQHYATTANDVRLDQPKRATGPQTLGLHVTFTVPFERAVSLLHDLSGLTPIIRLETVAFATAGLDDQVVVTADGLLAWAPPTL